MNTKNQTAKDSFRSYDKSGEVSGRRHLEFNRTGQFSMEPGIETHQDSKNENFE